MISSRLGYDSVWKKGLYFIEPTNVELNGIKGVTKLNAKRKVLSQKESKIVLFSAGIKWAVGLFRSFWCASSRKY